MNSPIKDFYANKTVLITGGHGYIGRLLLAKLLRLNIVKEILLLSRPRKGKSNEERLNELFEGFLFQEVARNDANFREKVKIVNGDCEVRDLGVSCEDREYIKCNVEVIIHGAAALSLDGKLKHSIATNVRGTKQLLDLAIESKHLKSFVFISTAFSQCPKGESMEVFYDTPVDYREAIQLLEDFSDEDALNVVMKKLISPWPNAYVFTKAVAEDMLRQYQDRLPVAIVRPSVVMSTYVDPVAGFSDSLLGNLGLCLAIMTGILRVAPVSGSQHIDNVAADVTVNSILAVGMKTSGGDQYANIFNVVSNNKKITGAEFIKLVAKHSREFPTMNMIRLPKPLTFVESKILFRILFMFYNVIPALLLDMILKVSQSKSMSLMKMMRNMSFFFSVSGYFDKSFKFDNRNLRKLHADMTLGDHFYFPCSMGLYDFDTFVRDAVKGIKKYHLKENDDNFEEGRKRLKVLYLIDFSIDLLCCVAIYFIYCKIF